MQASYDNMCAQAFPLDNACGRCMWIVNHTRKLGTAKRTIQTLPSQVNHRRAPNHERELSTIEFRYAILVPTSTELRPVFVHPVFVCTRSEYAYDAGDTRYE